MFVRIALVILILSNLSLLYVALLPGIQGTWSQNSGTAAPTANKLADSPDLIEFFPLQGMAGYNLDNNEACLRLEGFLKDSSFWLESQQSRKVAFEERKLKNLLQKRTCSVEHKKVAKWVWATVRILQEYNHPQAATLQYKLRRGMPAK